MPPDACELMPLAGEEVDLDKIDASPLPAKSTSCRPGLPAYVVFALIIGFVILTVIQIATCRSKPLPIAGPSPALIRASPREDYILDLDWDFKASPAVREYFWTIHDTERRPDGVLRSMILINNRFPGPLIRCNDGDTIIVHVENHARNATSIHWHGIYQNASDSFMDGTVGITQCPIAPDSSFTYQFTIRGQSGSYWYHAHHSVQGSDGLIGPMIIHSRNEREIQPLPYDTDRIVMVQDHYHSLSGELLMKYLEPDRENIEPVPDGALINGKALCHVTSNTCDDSAVEIFNLEPSRNHRLRFINSGAFAEFQIQIDEHEFAVTEVDGTDVYVGKGYRL